MGEYRMILLPFYFLFIYFFTLSEKLSSEWRIPYSLCPTTNLISGLPGYQLVKNWPAVQETHFDSWVRKIHWKRDRVPTPVFLGFPCGSTGKESASNVGDLGWEDPLEKEMATHASILAWKIPWMGSQSMGLQRVRYD